MRVARRFARRAIGEVGELVWVMAVSSAGLLAAIGARGLRAQRPAAVGGDRRACRPRWRDRQTRRIDSGRLCKAVREPLTGSSEISVRGAQPGRSWRERARCRPSTDRSPTTRVAVWRTLDRERQAIPTVRSRPCGVLIWRRVRSRVAQGPIASGAGSDRERQEMHERGRSRSSFAWRKLDREGSAGASVRMGGRRRGSSATMDG
jgi:hypothetical protein